MIVTIWRHGEAGRAVSDRLRELTVTGAADVGFACHRFHDICHARGIPHPELVLHSAWVRTTQTADIIASAFTQASLSPNKALQPGGSIEAVDAALADITVSDPTVQHVVLVSHQPLVSYLVDYYLGCIGRVPSLSPGGLVSLDLQIPAVDCGQLLFSALPPEYKADT
jgi:phosphohistidine phosphatase